MSNFLGNRHKIFLQPSSIYPRNIVIRCGRLSFTIAKSVKKINIVKWGIKSSNGTLSLCWIFTCFFCNGKSKNTSWFWVQFFRLFAKLLLANERLSTRWEYLRCIESIDYRLDGVWKTFNTFLRKLLTNTHTLLHFPSPHN